MNKNIYRFFIVASFVGMLGFIVFGISQVLSYLNSGADRSSMLHLALNNEEVYLPELVWKDTLNLGRPMESYTLKNIEKDYVKAWYVRHVALQTNVATGLEEYYTANARQQIIATITANKLANITIHGTTTRHELSVDFYSADGQLAVITATGVRMYLEVFKNGKKVLETTSTSDYQMVVLLEDGYWRIRHCIKKGHVPSAKEVVTKSRSFPKVVGDTLLIDQKPYQIKGINYYPQKTPWDMYGASFDRKVIIKDFELIKRIGLNTIRIFVPYHDFGGASVHPDKLEKLTQVLDSAEKSGLKVIVTLFDFYGDYGVRDWTLTHRHAEQIVITFKTHKAILAWDIKNEPDLDFADRGKESVLAWLREMVYQVRQFDPNHLVTVGWSNLESASLLCEQLDILSFHYYKDIEDFEKRYALVKANVRKPLVLQEFGLSSNQSLWNPLGASEKQQATYYTEFQQLLKKEHIPYLFWTLYDFNDIPDSVAGIWPWRKQKQKCFGILDLEGNHKEAFERMSK